MKRDKLSQWRLALALVAFTIVTTAGCNNVERPESFPEDSSVPPAPDSTPSDPSTDPSVEQLCGDGLDNDADGFVDCDDDDCAAFPGCNEESSFAPVSLLVQEALDQDDVGRNRAGEMVTVGLPFALRVARQLPKASISRESAGFST